MSDPTARPEAQEPWVIWDTVREEWWNYGLRSYCTDASRAEQYDRETAQNGARLIDGGTRLVAVPLSQALESGPPVGYNRPGYRWNGRVGSEAVFTPVPVEPTTPPDYQADVRAFHEALVPDQVADRPTMPPGKIINLRLDLIEEEFGELWAALHRGDLVAVADALADLLYVTYGTAVACGIEIAPIWREVHRSNMAKLGGPISPTGKLLKPEGWTPPDVRGELERQGWTDDGRGGEPPNGGGGGG